MFQSGMTLRLAAGLWLLCWGLAACSLFPQFSGSARMQVEQLRSLSVCNSEDAKPRVTLVADAFALRAWQEGRHVDLLGPAPLPPAGAYVVVEMGQRSSAGYAIAVSRQAWLSRDLVTLNASLLTPPADAPAAEVVTSPCALVALPGGSAYRGVELRDAGGTLLAETRLP